MSSYQYLSEQLLDVLQSLQAIETSSVIQVSARPDFPSEPRDRVLIVNGGEPVYGGSEIPDRESLARSILGVFKPNSIEAALRVARQKAIFPDSVQEILSLLVRMRVVTREQVQRFLHARLLWTIESLQPYPGEIRVESGSHFDVRPMGISWEKIRDDLDRRRQEWALLTPTIPSMEAIPVVTNESLVRVNDRKVVEHLRRWVDGRRSLLDIAESLPNQDPLPMARGYFRWVQLEWVSLRDPIATANPATRSAEREKPTILAVDDSPVVQAMIKRALQAHYHVLLASSAREALDLLDRKSIELLLLDVTMPDMDGLEVCRTVREIPRFKELPIIMLTSRDAYSDKFKGYMAGSTKYITKPFKPEELLAVISEYVSAGVLSPVA